MNWSSRRERHPPTAAFNRICPAGLIHAQYFWGSLLLKNNLNGVFVTLPISRPPTSAGAIRSAEALQTIIDVLATPIFVKDRDHCLLLVNDSMCDFMGRSKQELIGKSDFDFVPPEEAEIFWQKDDLVFKTGEENENEEKITDRDGQQRTIVTRKRLVHIEGVPLLIAVITDITAFREAEAHSRYLAYHDTLSGLPNRAVLSERIDGLLTGPAAEAECCGLLYVDLDRFKQVNDAYGHAAGDELIREFAKRLTSLVRSTDTVARIGGDEFAILLSGAPSVEVIAKLCRRILAAARSPFIVAGATVHVDASIGVVPGLQPDTSRSDILRRADVALYNAKKEGRGCYRVYSEAMDEGRSARLAVENELREAIESDRGIELRYQPLFSGDVITGVEALVRWNHPRLGLLAPSGFMPIAEETGLVVPLGDIVLERACGALKHWPGITLAVNLSPVQLRDVNFSTRVLKKLRKFSLDPERLELEITETAMLSADATTQAHLRKLRAAGIKIALDDFGTGYSSLSHLQSLHVDRIKIDQSFVRHLGQSSDSAPIIQAVVHIARMFGLKVTAEGVETDSQRQFLLETGCSHLQGFLLSPPLPEDQIGPMLARPVAVPPGAQPGAYAAAHAR